MSIDYTKSFEENFGNLDANSDLSNLSQLLEFDTDLVEPSENLSKGEIIVVDNIPIVPVHTESKLINVINGKFSKVGKIVNFYYPKADGKTLGYVFIQYETRDMANRAIKELNRFKLDKKHTFLVNHLKDIEECDFPSQNPLKPTLKAYLDPTELYGWMLDNENDQFFIRFHKSVDTDVFEIYENNNAKISEPILSRENWSENFDPIWSTYGSYLLTFHALGVIFWGGSQFKIIAKFSHSDVVSASFSSCEKFLFTTDRNNVHIIWEILTGLKMREFDFKKLVYTPFKWNYDNKYFSNSFKHNLYIYESESFTMLNKKSITIPYLLDYVWSPSTDIISYTVDQNTGFVKIALMEIPSLKLILEKTYVNTSACNMYWQDNSNYLAVVLTKFTSRKEINEEKANSKDKENKKGDVKENQEKEIVNVEVEVKDVNENKNDGKDKEKYNYYGVSNDVYIFRLKEKNVPIEKIDIKGNVVSFDWEPNGYRFSICTCISKNVNTFTFYAIQNTGSLNVIGKLENKVYTSVDWSSSGQSLVMKSESGDLEFAHITFSEIIPTLYCCQQGMTESFWDNSGKHYISYSTSDKSDTAYIIWSSHGRQLFKKMYQNLCKFSFRPKQAIGKSYKNYRKSIRDEILALSTIPQSVISQYTNIQTKRRTSRKNIFISTIADGKKKMRFTKDEKTKARPEITYTDSEDINIIFDNILN
ncbi:hypothetical protein A3Q56_02143 [Intoshia linei]|uniref:RRM domain-containing protein n=1 Tax=Intoshia linei TaxID=1819745 RepID=A0A177B8V6_9BILA|nr:hypothetical protein A3Q56_02143 [Intoshia linei]